MMNKKHKMPNGKMMTDAEMKKYKEKMMMDEANKILKKKKKSK